MVNDYYICSTPMFKCMLRTAGIFAFHFPGLFLMLKYFMIIIMVIIMVLPALNLMDHIYIYTPYIFLMHCVPKKILFRFTVQAKRLRRMSLSES